MTRTTKSRSDRRQGATGTRERKATGIRSKTLADGRTRYYVEDGTGSDRLQATFDTLVDAKAYKADCVRRRKSGTRRLTKDDWLADAGRPDDPSGSSGAPGSKNISARDHVAYVNGLACEEAKDSNLVSEANVFVRFLTETGRIDRPYRFVDAKCADAFRTWIFEERYAKEYQGMLLAFADRVGREAVRQAIAVLNPFDGLRTLGKETPTDRRGRPRLGSAWREWTPSEVVAVARLIPARYQAFYWTCLLVMLRASEVAGIQLRHYDAAAGVLRVTQQRRASSAKGTTTTKTAAGTRDLPLCRVVRALFDELIERDHGPEPTDRSEAAAWRARYLFLGRSGGPMCVDSARDAVKRAFDLAGISEACGFDFRPLHHLRKTGSSWLMRSERRLVGSAVSYYLGHETSVTNAFDTAARRAG